MGVGCGGCVEFVVAGWSFFVGRGGGGGRVRSAPMFYIGIYDLYFWLIWIVGQGLHIALWGDTRYYLLFWEETQFGCILRVYELFLDIYIYFFPYVLDVYCYTYFVLYVYVLLCLFYLVFAFGLFGWSVFRRFFPACREMLPVATTLQF